MAFMTVVLVDDNGSEGFSLQTWKSGSIADACLACVKSCDWSLAHKTNGTAKQNKQPNKTEPWLLGDTLTHSMALHLGVW